MMKTLTFLFTVCSGFFWWAGFFLVCRLAVWAAGQQSWCTVPLAFAAGTAWHGVRALGRNSGRFSRDDGRDAGEGLRKRLRRDWQDGRYFRAGGLLRRPPPVFLFLNPAAERGVSMLELADASSAGAAGEEREFAWRRGPEAVWLDFPESPAPDGDRRWRYFSDMAAECDFAGVVVILDAGRLVADGDFRAPVLRTRLEALQRGRRHALPVYLVIDNLDCLYGLRSLVSALPSRRLEAPFGGLRDMLRENSPAFFRRVFVDSAQAIGQDSAASGPAGILAPGELLRLEAPLVQFCRQVFRKGRDDDGGTLPWIRGLFFTASAPGSAPAVPSLLSPLAGFAPRLETLPVQPWFLRRLLRHDIPADAGPARLAGGGGRGRRVSRPAAVLMAASLAVSALLSWTFWENRAVLLSVRGRAGYPEAADELENYRALASGAQSRVEAWTLPRFGMTEAEDLAGELRRRYTESYFNLKTIPAIEHIQDAAIRAAGSSDPTVIGNTLLLLALTRESLAGSPGDEAGDAGGGAGFLRGLALSLELITPEDIRQMRAFAAWSGDQAWAPETARTLEQFETYLLDNAGGGDISLWLTGWVGAMPGLQAVDTSRVWDAPLADNSSSVIAREWTREGYAIARALLAAVAYQADDPGVWREKSALALSRYRNRALEEWRGAAAALWNKFSRRIPDGDVTPLLRAATRGDDPARRFFSLLRRHLIPMFAADPATDNPDVRWLLLRDSLPDGNAPGAGAAAAVDAGGVRGFAFRLAGAVDAVPALAHPDVWAKATGVTSSGADGPPLAAAWTRWQDAIGRFGVAAETPTENFRLVGAHYRGESAGPGSDPLLQAGEEAAFLHRELRAAAGTGAWDSLSPLAVYDYVRYLATRKAALHLDSLWREDVYTPARLAGVRGASRPAALAAGPGQLRDFLTGPAKGYWTWDGLGVVNAEWRRLPFMFDDVFLEFCRSVLQDRGSPASGEKEALLEIRGVRVDAGAKELPLTLELVWQSGQERQTVFFNNYRIAEPLVWRPGREMVVGIRLYFPSIAATTEVSGAIGVAGIVSALTHGELVLDAGVFGAAEEVLRRMGVNTVTIDATLENGGDVMALLRNTSVTVPQSIITPGPALIGAAMADGVLGNLR